MQFSLFDSPPALSVSDITRHIRHILDVDDVLQDIWVEGEISNWSRASSGHIYFTLKDAQASIRCVIWRSSVPRLKHLPGGSGESVMAHGRVSVYEAQGAYQLYVDNLEALGQGDFYAEFERVKAKLSEEGLFDAAYKKPLPQFPRRIGVVTSAQAAAFRDVLNVLSRRFPLGEVVLSPTLVQGEGAPQQIIQALIRLINLENPVDVILLTRGGGSIEDLWAFNNELLARTVVASQIPIITGVGHETDFTIVDFVSDQRAPTPSAAAEIATPDLSQLPEILPEYESRLRDALHLRLDNLKQALDDRQWRLRQKSPQRDIDNRRQDVDERQASLRRSLRYRLELSRERLANAQSRLKTLDPKAVLARGYAIIQKDEQVIASVDDIAPGQNFRVILSNGDFEATRQPSQDKN